MLRAVIGHPAEVGERFFVAAGYRQPEAHIRSGLGLLADAFSGTQQRRLVETALQVPQNGPRPLPTGIAVLGNRQRGFRLRWATRAPGSQGPHEQRIHRQILSGAPESQIPRQRLRRHFITTEPQRMKCLRPVQRRRKLDLQRVLHRGSGLRVALQAERRGVHS